MKITVYDDEGALAMSRVSEFASVQEALEVIDEVVVWTNEDGSELYSPSQCHAHLNELAQLKLEVKAQLINVQQPDWFESGLGFTFSIK
ncbi:hypothetical protein [Vibrio campbellii]|uniref:hypothetical protein n=1 Tax=Vibrio campbellii TaxID=680 RepID=UPI001F176677|nr:hypothetical protein [Vibrio campbellii]MCE7733053.1 hypothetical protein [Vibrio campbellii]